MACFREDAGSAALPLRDALLWPLAAPIAAEAAARAVNAFPVAGALVVGPSLGFALVRSGMARASFLLFGGLIVFQRSNEVTLLKAWFLCGALLCLAVALRRVVHEWSGTTVRLARPLLALSGLFGAVALASVWTALTDGTPLLAWGRDAAPYLLFASVVPLALDLHASVPRRVLVTMVLVAGVLSAIGFCIEWLTRREMLTIVVWRPWLPSFLLSAVPFAYASARFVLGSPRRIGWIAVAGLVGTLVLVTGTRSGVLLFVAPLAVAVACAAGDIGRPWAGAVVFIGAVTVSLVVVVPIVATVLGVEAPMSARMALGLDLIEEPTRDLSFQERVNQTRSAWQMFKREPLLGVGFGHTFRWAGSSGEERSGFNIDSPLAVPAKFGVLGTLVLLAMAVELVRLLVRRLLPMTDDPGGALTLAGFLGVAAAAALLFSPIEDKGCSLGLGILLAVALPRRGLAPSDGTSVGAA